MWRLWRAAGTAGALSASGDGGGGLCASMCAAFAVLPRLYMDEVCRLLGTTSSCGCSPAAACAAQGPQLLLLPTWQRMACQSSTSFSVQRSTMVDVYRGEASLARYGP